MREISRVRREIPNKQANNVKNGEETDLPSNISGAARNQILNLHVKRQKARH